MAYNKTFSGGPRVLVNLLEKLDAARFQALVLTNRESPMTEALRKMGFRPEVIALKGRLALDREGALKGGMTNRLRTLREALRYNREVAEFIRNERPDVVWVRNVKGVMLTGWAALRYRIPLIWDIGMEKPSRGPMLLIHGLGFLLSARVVSEAGSVPDKIFPGWMRRLFRKKLVAIRSGISEERVSALEAAAKRRISGGPDLNILFLGAIDERKNPLMLLRALCLLKRQRRLKVTLAGPSDDPRYRTLLEGYIADHGLGDAVRFAGWQEDIAGLMANSQLFVMTSDNEGVPYALLEAMHASLPVIATPVGGIPDIIRHGNNGWIVAPGDAEGLASLIGRILRLADRGAETGRRGKAFVREYHSQKQWVKSYEGLLEQLIKS